MTIAPAGLGWAMPDLGEGLAIGPLATRNRVFLAPMSGISDMPFRQLAWQFGAGLVFSEMIASEALVGGEAEMVRKLERAEDGIHAVQLAGCEAKWLALAARIAVDGGADLVDINMGCPAKRVTNGYAGSALMRDLDHARRLIDAVVDAVPVPVTLKMRLGWDNDSINAPQLAVHAEQAGIAMITVHGRTRCQFYKGRADWAALRAVREAVGLPLVVNGDIASHADALEALRQSGADAVMVGRASCGMPWLAGQIAGHPSAPPGLPARDFVVATALRHHTAMVEAHGAHLGIRQARKHLAAYLDVLGEPAGSPLRRRILTADEAANVHDALQLLLVADARPERRAA